MLTDCSKAKPRSCWSFPIGFCNMHRKFTSLPKECVYQNTYECLKSLQEFHVIICMKISCNNLHEIIWMKPFKDNNNNKNLCDIWSPFPQKSHTQSTFIIPKKERKKM